MKGIFAAAIATSAVVASAASIGANNKKAATTAGYDDIEIAIPGVSFVELEDYKGLNYDGFAAADNSQAPLVGIRPVSLPNVIVSGLLGPATKLVATVRPADGFNRFSFQEFNFGCTVNTVEGIAGVARPCTVTVTGNKNGKQVAQRDVKFNPGLLNLDPEMQNIKFDNKWADVDEVSFQPKGVLRATTTVIYDNFVYTLLK